MKEKYLVKKKYDELPQTDVLRFGNDFVDGYILEDNTKLSINGLRIIFNIVATLRMEQFQEEKQPKQLKLFEEEFASEHNVFAEMKIKNSLITRNSDELKKAYEELENFKKGWHKFETSNGKTIQAYGGLISNMFYDEKGYTSFLISSYWLKKLINIPEYNATLYKLVYNVRSNKHILFWFWLSKVPHEGTKVKRETINEKFGVNYSTAKDLCKDFLKPIRENLDKHNVKSFNYSIEGDIIHIKPYAVQNVLTEGLQPQTIEKIKKVYKLRYFKDRHELSEQDIKGIALLYQNKSFEKEKQLLTNAYENFIQECRTKKQKATAYTGQNFINQLQEHLKQAYLKTKTGEKYPNAFPRI